MKTKISLSKNIFWDIDFKNLDTKSHSVYIIGRILEYGDREAVIWMMKNFKKSQIKKVLSGEKGFSPKSANYWASILDVSKNKILCLKKSYQKMQKSHWLP